MRSLLAVVGVGVVACATTRVCPTESRLASEDRPTGRVEWCAKPAGGVSAMPAPGRTYPSLFGMAHPSAMSGGLRGPYTHWYPNGGVESHGRYVEDGSTSVPNGVWGFWYPDGTRKRMGRYELGRPVGCFAVWDEQGNQVTGIVEGDQLLLQRCEPPTDDALTQIESRSHPSSARSQWGDASLLVFGQRGELGASNATQRDPDPSARATVQAAVRKHLGRFRVGPALGLRVSDTDNARAYSAGVVAAIGVPLRYRLGAEAEAQLGIQYFGVTASRMDVPGVGSASFWAPLGSARLAISFAVMPTLLVVGGLSLDGSPSRDADRDVRYCAPLCSPPIKETWNIGGAAYGFSLGLRLMLR